MLPPQPRVIRAFPAAALRAIARQVVTAAIQALLAAAALPAAALRTIARQVVAAAVEAPLAAAAFPAASLCDRNGDGGQTASEVLALPMFVAAILKLPLGGLRILLLKTVSYWQTIVPSRSVPS